jgi:hypothetical protein
MAQNEDGDIAAMIERRRKYLSEMHSRMMRHDDQKGRSLMSVVEQDAHFTPNKNAHHRRYQNRSLPPSKHSNTNTRSTTKTSHHASYSKSKRKPFSNDVIMGIVKNPHHSSSESHKPQPSQSSSSRKSDRLDSNNMASDGGKSSDGSNSSSIDASLKKLSNNISAHIYQMIEKLSSNEDADANGVDNVDKKRPQPLLVGWIIVKLEKGKKNKKNDEVNEGDATEYVILPECEPEIILDGERRDLRTSAKYVFQRYKATKRHLSDLNEKNFSLGVVLYNIKMRRATAYKLSIKRNKPGEESKFGRNRLQCKLLNKDARVLKTSLEEAIARRWKVFN